MAQRLRRFLSTMMVGKRFALFELCGITVRIDLSWLLIAGLITWSLALGLFPQRFTSLSTTWHWIMALAAAFGLFVSIILHELAHGVAAMKLGIPMHGITLFLFGGVAEMAEEPRTPKAELWMAAAGPIASVLLAIMFLPFALDVELALELTPISGIAEYLAVMNLLLAAFNLVPAFPLDGGRIMRALIWWWSGDLHRATRIAAGAGRFFGACFFGLGVLEMISAEIVAGVWWILIGLFLRGAAKGALEQMVARAPLSDVPEAWQNTPTGDTVHRPLSPSRHTQPNLAS
jgi:Zn-dependent protease